MYQDVLKLYRSYPSAPVYPHHAILCITMYCVVLRCINFVFARIPNVSNTHTIHTRYTHDTHKIHPNTHPIRTDTQSIALLFNTLTIHTQYAFNTSVIHSRYSLIRDVVKCLTICCKYAQDTCKYVSDMTKYEVSYSHLPWAPRACRRSSSSSLESTSMAGARVRAGAGFMTLPPLFLAAFFPIVASSYRTLNLLRM